MAAALGAEDSAQLHAADTIAAGAELCDAAAVKTIIGTAPGVVAMLQRFGVAFDRTPDGALALGLEAAHSRRRILHIDGDGSGAAIIRALVEAVRATPSIAVLDHAEVCSLQVDEGAISGIVCCVDRKTSVIPTFRVLLATGGLGGLFDATTNPPCNFGHGIALAARAGAVLSDMEFVQFHPTALCSARRPLALVSEALRGEGAVLVDDKGRPIMEGVREGDLAPRDVVARAVATEIRRGGAVHLDARSALGSRFPVRFPTVSSLCRDAGIDPSRQLIPVTPAAHYHMGGIDVDGRGRSSIAGLWAAGEVASTGLHGANRLASNSLLEAAVTGIRAAEDMALFPPRRMSVATGIGDMQPRVMESAGVQDIVSAHLGVLRDGEGLKSALTRLLPLVALDQPSAQPAAVALLIAVFAMLRTETRGSHARIDFPQRLQAAARQKMTLPDAVKVARALTTEPILRRA